MGGPMTNQTTNMQLILQINARIRVDSNVGTIKFIGNVNGYAGIWVGVEWDDHQRGKHNGTVKGIKYFDTSHPTSGSLIRPEKISKFENVHDAIENRYINSGDKPLDDNLFKELKKISHAALFEFVGLRNISEKQCHWENLTNVELNQSNINSAGNLSLLKNLSELILSSSLITTWSTLAEIVKQLPSLTILNFSNNRLDHPTDDEIEELRPSFNHLKSINLSQCNLQSWKIVLHIAKLWPHIEFLALNSNDINTINESDDNTIFTNLYELSLQNNGLSSFEDINKLSNIYTLKSLDLESNGIEQIKFSDCPPSECLTNEFVNLEQINLKDNPISNHNETFNELDKLPALRTLLISTDQKIDFENLFSNAVARITKLQYINRVLVTETQRRGAQYDLWKSPCGLEWIQSQKNETEKLKFAKSCRAYEKIVEKYGSPADLVVVAPKVSNLITITIETLPPTKRISKRIPRKITVQTLQGIILKLFSGLLDDQFNISPTLFYVDGKNNDIRVRMDNLSKNLDYYSIQDGDSVVVEW